MALLLRKSARPNCRWRGGTPVKTRPVQSTSWPFWNGLIVDKDGK